MDSSLKQHKPCQWIIQDGTATCWLPVLPAPGRQHWATHTTGSWRLTMSRTHMGPQNEEELFHKVLFSKSWWAMLQVYHARVTVLPASPSNYLSWAELIFNEHCGCWKGFFLRAWLGFVLLWNEHFSLTAKTICLRILVFSCVANSSLNRCNAEHWHMSLGIREQSLTMEWLPSKCKWSRITSLRNTLGWKKTKRERFIAERFFFFLTMQSTVVFTHLFVNWLEGKVSIEWNEWWENLPTVGFTKKHGQRKS